MFFVVRHCYRLCVIERPHANANANASQDSSSQFTLNMKLVDLKHVA